QLGRVARGGREGLREGVVGLLQLLVDELAADLLLARQCGDRLPGEGVQGELLARGRRQLGGRAGKGGDRRGRRGGDGPEVGDGMDMPGTPKDQGRLTYPRSTESGPFQLRLPHSLVTLL